MSELNDEILDEIDDGSVEDVTEDDIRDSLVITVPLDSTLTINGAAADARAVGQAVNAKVSESDVKSLLSVNGRTGNGTWTIMTNGGNIPAHSDSDSESVADALDRIDTALTTETAARESDISDVEEQISNVSGTTIPVSAEDSTKVKTYIDNAIQTEQTARANAIQAEQTARGLVEQRVGTLEQNALTVDAVINALYPVGSTYISMNSTMPTALTKGRTWTAITGDYVLRTITSGTGGAFSNAGNTGSTALTVAQIPSHRHNTEGASNVVTTAGTAGGWVGGTQTEFPVVAQDTYTSYTGSGQGHTHTAGMPKNVAIYMWKRTA